MAITSRVQSRIQSALKQMVPIIQQQKTRDVSEADTVTLVKDVLSTAGGYDKYIELTSEHAIRGTFCDLAIQVDDKLRALVEVKSAGTTLDDRHVKQAIDYAANQGIEWVILTNASTWRLYNVIFAKPIDKRLVVELDVTTLDLRKDADVERFFVFTKEGFDKGAHIELKDRQDATNKFMLAALLTCNESVVSAIRRELRRVVGVLVAEDELVGALRADVIKRETLEGADAEAACRRVNRSESKALRSRSANASAETEVAEALADGSEAQAPL